MTELEWKTQISPMLTNCWAKLDDHRQLEIWAKKLRWLSARAVKWAIDEYYAEHGRLSSPSIKAIISIAKSKPGWKDQYLADRDSLLGNSELFALYTLHKRTNRIPSEMTQQEFGKWYDDRQRQRKLDHIKKCRQAGLKLYVDNFYYYSPLRNARLHVTDGSVLIPAGQDVTTEQWFVKLQKACGLGISEPRQDKPLADQLAEAPF